MLFKTQARDFWKLRKDFVLCRNHPSAYKPGVGMSPFEFICAFYSVVLGVAVAQLMTSVGRLIEVRDQVRTYWVQSLWVVTVLLVDINSWWAMWDLRNEKSWSVLSFFLLVGLVASIFLVTVLLFPRVPESGEQTDLDAHYYKNRRFFFLANAAGWTLGLLCNLSFLPIKSWLNPAIIFPLPVVLLSVLAAITGNRRYHAAFAVFALITVAVALLTDPTRIQ